LSYEIKEYLMPLVAMDAMAVAMFELQRISMVQNKGKHTTPVNKIVVLCWTNKATGRLQTVQVASGTFRLSRMSIPDEIYRRYKYEQTVGMNNNLNYLNYT